MQLVVPLIAPVTQVRQSVPHWLVLSFAAQAPLIGQVWWFEVSQICVQTWFAQEGV